MKMDARQFGFMVVALLLGAGVLFVVGFEVGRVVNFEGYGAFIAGLMTSPDKNAAKNSAQASIEEFSFFDELDAPAEPHQRRAVKSPDWNANNEGLDYSRFRGKRPRYRQLARMKRPKRSGDRRVLSRESRPEKRSARRDASRDVIAAVPDGRVLERDVPSAADDNAGAVGRRVLGRSEAPRAEASDSRRYALQAGAFSDKGEADQVLAQLKSRGLPARVVSGNAPGRGRVHRVLVGRYGSMDEAKAAQGKVGRRTIIRAM